MWCNLSSQAHLEEGYPTMHFAAESIVSGKPDAVFWKYLFALLINEFGMRKTQAGRCTNRHERVVRWMPDLPRLTKSGKDDHMWLPRRPTSNNTNHIRQSVGYRAGFMQRQIKRF